MENRESPNSHAVDESPSTSSFNSQMFQAENVESPNSCMAVEVDLDDIPLTRVLTL